MRSVQVHDRGVERAEAGQRVAVEPRRASSDASSRRGDALVAPGAYPTSYRLDVRSRSSPTIPAAVSVHHGTARIAARVVRAGDARRAAPARRARRRGPRRSLRAAHARRPSAAASCSTRRRRAASTPSGSQSLEARRRAARSCTSRSRRGRSRCAGFSTGSSRRPTAGSFSPEWLDEPARRASPADRGRPTRSTPASAPPSERRGRRRSSPLLGLERRGAKLYLPGAAAVARRRAPRRPSSRAPSSSRVTSRSRSRRSTRARSSKRAAGRPRRRRLRRSAAPRTHSARDLLVAECEAAGRSRSARFRDLLGSSRRPAQLLLERFDADGLTRRVGDARVLRRARYALSSKWSSSGRL